MENIAHCPDTSKFFYDAAHQEVNDDIKNDILTISYDDDFSKAPIENLLINIKSLNSPGTAMLNNQLCRIVVPLSLAGSQTDNHFFYYCQLIKLLSSPLEEELQQQVYSLKHLIRYFSNNHQWKKFCTLIKQKKTTCFICEIFKKIEKNTLQVLCQHLRKISESNISIQNQSVGECLPDELQRYLDCLALIDALIAYQASDDMPWYATRITQSKIDAVAAIMNPDAMADNQKNSSLCYVPLIINHYDGYAKLHELLKLIPQYQPASIIVTGNQHTVALHRTSKGETFWCNVDHLCFENFPIAIPSPGLSSHSEEKDLLWTSLVSRFAENSHCEPAQLLCCCQMITKNNFNDKSQWYSKAITQKELTLKYAQKMPIDIQEQIFELFIQNYDLDSMKDFINLYASTKFKKKLAYSPELFLKATILADNGQAIEYVLKKIQTITKEDPFRILNRITFNDKIGDTVLHMASALGCTTIITTLHKLITQSNQWLVLIKKATHYQSTPIWLAATCDHADTLEVLINSIIGQTKTLKKLLTASDKADLPLISVIAKNGFTDPLMKLIAILGDDLSALVQKDKKGLTPLYWAKSYTKKSGQSLTEELLLQAINRASFKENDSCIIL